MRDIRVSFGGVHAVDGVSVDLYPGEVVALVGGNGAGKSTLMHTLSGAHPADSGQILINGEPVTDPQPARRQDGTGSRRSTRSWRWPTTSTRPATCSSAGRCARAPARSTTRRWRRRPREVMQRLNPRFTNLKTPVELAVRRPAPGRRHRPGDPLQRPDPDHGRADRGARSGRDEPGARARRPAEVRGHRDLPHQPRHPRRVRPGRPDQRDAHRRARRHRRTRTTSPRTRCWR